MVFGIVNTTYFNCFLIKTTSLQILPQVCCKGASEKERGNRCIFSSLIIPYWATICFRPSYSVLEMQTSELRIASSRFSKVDQTTRPEQSHLVICGQFCNSQNWHWIWKGR